MTGTADEPEIIMAKTTKALHDIVDAILPLPPLSAVAVLGDMIGRIVQNYGKTPEGKQEMMAMAARFTELGRRG